MVVLRGKIPGSNQQRLILCWFLLFKGDCSEYLPQLSNRFSKTDDTLEYTL